MRLFIEDEGNLYELVKSEVGCQGCKWCSSTYSDSCEKRDECRAAADLLFGHKAYRHWEEISMG